MKKFINVFLFFILSLFSLYLDVNAVSGGYSGEGQGQGYTGGTSSGGDRCLGGACLAAGAGLKFTLVDISNSKLEAKAYGYMRSAGNLYGGDYFDNRNYHGGGAIEGIILSSGEYSYGAYGKGNYIELTRFSNMGNIIPKAEAGLNFYEDRLKQSILRDPNCSSKGTECILTDEFANISVTLLRKANIISASDTLNSITTEQKNTISNLRIIIEPVYALFLNGYKFEKYVFSTPKSMAFKVASNDYYGKNHVLGIGDFASLYNQIYTKDTLGTIINYPSYIVPTSNEAKVKSFLNLNSGAGYSIAKILYDNSKCDIEKENGEFTFIDDRGERFANDVDGYNFQYYLNKDSSGCGCEIFNAYSYKNELLNSNEKFQEFYDNLCDPPVAKKCEYEKNGENYIFYGKTGNTLSSYSDFISECECTNANVIALKSEGAFASIYNSSCVGSSTESYSEPITACDIDKNPNYDAANSTTNFENYKLTYTKTTSINNYCTEVCVEEININNLKGRYTTEAGTYFEFSTYPSLVANKTCTVSIYYDRANPNIAGAKSWLQAYNDSLEPLVNAYNDWQGRAGAEASLKISAVNDCAWDCWSCGLTLCCGYTKKYYTYNYNYYPVVINNSTNLTRGTSPINYYQQVCGSTYDWQVSIKKSYFELQSSTANDSIASLKTALKTCNNRLGINKSNITTDDTITDEKFYSFDQKLNYYYAQTYSKNGIGIKYNNERSSYGGVDDSNFVEDGETIANQSGSGGDREYATLTIAGMNRETIYTYTSDIERNVQYSVFYSKPDKEKYAEVFTGKISTIKNVGKSIELGYVYDTDVSAKAMKGNDHYYSFTKLGDDSGYGKLFEHFKTHDDSIQRHCDFEITNQVIGCDDGICTDESKLDIVFRIVDSNNIDPNNRLVDKTTGTIISYNEDVDGAGNSNGFKNWRDEKGLTVKTAIENSDTFNPDNLEYSFTLDSATIKKIREYNSNCVGGSCNPIKYSDTKTSYSELSCNVEGNECTSAFITELKESSGQFGSEIATNTDGRDKWKYLIYNSTNGKWSIEEYDKGDFNSFSSLITQYKSLGVDVTP